MMMHDDVAGEFELHETSCWGNFYYWLLIFLWEHIQLS